MWTGKRTTAPPASGTLESAVKVTFDIYDALWLLLLLSIPAWPYLFLAWVFYSAGRANRKSMNERNAKSDS